MGRTYAQREHTCKGGNRHTKGDTKERAHTYRKTQSQKKNIPTEGDNKRKATNVEKIYSYDFTFTAYTWRDIDTKNPTTPFAKKKTDFLENRSMVKPKYSRVMDIQ